METPAKPPAHYRPRFPALALFERRPLQRAQTIVIAGVRKPAHFRKSTRDSPAVTFKVPVGISPKVTRQPAGHRTSAGSAAGEAVARQSGRVNK